MAGVQQIKEYAKALERGTRVCGMASKPDAIGIAHRGGRSGDGVVRCEATMECHAERPGNGRGCINGVKDAGMHLGEIDRAEIANGARIALHGRLRIRRNGKAEAETDRLAARRLALRQRTG